LGGEEVVVAAVEKTKIQGGCPGWDGWMDGWE